MGGSSYKCFPWVDVYLHSVCRFKSQPYKRHLEASPLFGGQIAEAWRAAGASYLLRG